MPCKKESRPPGAFWQPALIMAAVLSLSLMVFSHPQLSSDREELGRFERLEPGLLVRSGSDAQRGLSVIVRFADGFRSRLSHDEAPSATEEMEDVQLHGTRAIYDAGGVPTRHFRSLRASSAIVDSDTLRRLAGNPHIARISMDHPVRGSLDTTSIAIGADQVWQGIPGQPLVSLARVSRWR